MMTAQSIQIDVYSDVVCPWCYIGKRRLETALASFDRLPVTVRYQPFMLDPTAPAEPSPVREVYEKKFGGAEAAQAILDRVTQEAAGEGLAFRMDIAQRANTLSAHRLLVLADTKGCQIELKEALMAAYFTQGRDIADHDTLVDLAAAAGIDRDEAAAWLVDGGGRDQVAEQLLFAADNNITGVPAYLFNQTALLPGAQPAEIFAKVLNRMADDVGAER